mmetsp:Transcript_10652/g.29531  ORF Transcript_10652/g.29531 Transcript_10652/m.29531 type:complete len:86 (+) Transcript_10652:1173-1430(+)
MGSIKAMTFERLIKVKVWSADGRLEIMLLLSPPIAGTTGRASTTIRNPQAQTTVKEEKIQEKAVASDLTRTKRIPTDKLPTNPVA